MILVGFCLAILPIILLRDFTPGNELRYLSIADEALRNHTFFAFTNHGIAYADKPPLYLWLVMLLRVILGRHVVFALSLLSVIPAEVILGVMNSWTRQEMDANSRNIAQMMLLTCGIFLGAIIAIRMDMLMCMFIVLALRSFWHLYTEASTHQHDKWLFPTYLFLALFTKGPLGILIPLCATATYLLLHRQGKFFAKLWGWRTWSVLIVCSALWWSLTYWEGGSAYLDNLLFHQTIGRAVNSFRHDHPVYYYLTNLWYCWAPWSILMVASIGMALRKGVARSPLHSFFLVTSLSTFVLLSCISSKLEIYMLPALPFMIYSVAIYLPRIYDKAWCRWTVLVPTILLALALPGLIATDWLGWLKSSGISHPSTSLYIAALAVSLGSIRAIVLLCGKPSPATYGKAIRSIVGGLFGCLFFGGLNMTEMNCYLGYGNLSQMTQQLAERNGIKHIASWKVKNASDMDVYLHQDVEVIDQEEAPQLPFREPTLLLLPTKRLKEINHTANKTVSVGDYTIIIEKK